MQFAMEVESVSRIERERFLAVQAGSGIDGLNVSKHGLLGASSYWQKSRS